MTTTKEIQDAALAQANSLSSQASMLLSNIQSIISNSEYDDGFANLSPPNLALTSYGVSTPLPPGAPALPEFSGIAPPDKPSLPQVDVPSTLNVPDFVMAAPIINIPDAPVVALPAAPGASPEFISPLLPTKPTISLPVAPTFAPVATPVAPSVSVPYFDMAADFGEVTAPTHSFSWSEQEYESVLLDETKAKILNDILNGGYGIDDADERRLWDRARERELLNVNAKLEDLNRTVAARGFNIPPGSLYAMQESAKQDYTEKVSSLSRDIAVKRADMYVENRKFAITSAIQVEDMMIRYFSGVAERALNAARAQVELGVAVFNAQLARYSAKVQAYNAYAQAFEARVRAALTNVEIYKAQVEGARLSIEAQRVHAEVYNTQVEGAQALMRLYQTEMEGAKTAADIETLKLQAFRTKVEAYGAQVQARMAEFQMFEAQVRGELAKVDMYRMSAEAYRARVGGVEAQARIAETTVRAQTTNAQLKLDAYRTDMDRYKSEVSVVAQRISSLLQKYNTEIQAYTANADAFSKNAALDNATDRLRVEAYTAHMSATLGRLDAQVKNYINYLNVVSGSSNEAARTTASLAASWAGNVTGLSATIEESA